MLLLKFGVCILMLLVLCGGWILVVALCWCCWRALLFDEFGCVCVYDCVWGVMVAVCLGLIVDLICRFCSGLVGALVVE